jgi:hypothetical protein
VILNGKMRDNREKTGMGKRCFLRLIQARYGQELLDRPSGFHVTVAGLRRNHGRFRGTRVQDSKGDQKKLGHAAPGWRINVLLPAGIMTLLCLFLFLPRFLPVSEAREVKENMRVVKVSYPDPDIARAVVQVTPDKKSDMFRKEKDVLGKDFAFSQYEIDVNCRENLVRLLSIGYLDRKGRVIYSSSVENPKWSPVVTDSASDKFRKLLCERRGAAQKK